jgi:hypothetical protein
MARILFYGIAMRPCMSMIENEQQRTTRSRGGKLAVLFSVAFWIISAGGIILMINLNK